MKTHPGTLARVFEAARLVAHCPHKDASDYQFLYVDAAKQHRFLLGQRCDTCGAVRTAHVEWIAPRFVRQLADDLDNLADLRSCLPAPPSPAAAEKLEALAFAGGDNSGEIVREIPEHVLAIAGVLDHLAELAESLSESGIGSRLREAHDVVRDFARALAPPVLEKAQA